MSDAELVNQLVIRYKSFSYPVVEFNNQDEKIISLDFTSKNTSLNSSVIGDVTFFCDYIEALLAKYSAKFGIGGYTENRTVYARSKHFDSEKAEPRRLHLA